MLTEEINKGTELMLRRKRKPSPVLKRLGYDSTFLLLKRQFRFILELRWENIPHKE